MVDNGEHASASPAGVVQEKFAKAANGRDQETPKP